MYLLLAESMFSYFVNDRSETNFDANFEIVFFSQDYQIFGQKNNQLYSSWFFIIIYVFAFNILRFLLLELKRKQHKRKPSMYFFFRSGYYEYQN